MICKQLSLPRNKCIEFQATKWSRSVSKVACEFEFLYNQPHSGFRFNAYVGKYYIHVWVYGPHKNFEGSGNQ